jgi:hypothetical protein
LAKGRAVLRNFGAQAEKFLDPNKKHLNDILYNKNKDLKKCSEENCMFLNLLLNLGFSKDLDYSGWGGGKKKYGAPSGALCREGPGLKSRQTLC